MSRVKIEKVGAPVGAKKLSYTDVTLRIELDGWDGSLHCLGGVRYGAPYTDGIQWYCCAVKSYFSGFPLKNLYLYCLSSKYCVSPWNISPQVLHNQIWFIYSVVSPSSSGKWKVFRWQFKIMHSALTFMGRLAFMKSLSSIICVNFCIGTRDKMFLDRTDDTNWWTSAKLPLKLV